jgi:hypothetical protein
LEFRETTFTPIPLLSKIGEQFQRCGETGQGKSSRKTFIDFHAANVEANSGEGCELIAGWDLC